MKLDNIIESKDVIIRTNIKTKRQLFQEMASKIASTEPNINEKQLLQAIFDREQLGNTGIGGGVALPSAKIDNIRSIRTVFSILTKPIPFESPDNKPVDIICLIISPNNLITKHLHYLSRFSRILNNKDISNRLRGCQNSDSVLGVLSNFDFSTAA